MDTPSRFRTLNGSSSARRWVGCTQPACPQGSCGKFRRRRSPRTGEKRSGNSRPVSRRRGFDEPLAAEMAALLRTERGRVSALLLRAEELAAALRARATPQVLCHGDMHPGNVLISGAGALYVVDWDTLIFAPREHDLALIGATWGGERELELLHRGYGPTEGEQTALAYYRYHRIVEDLAVVCEELLTTRDGGANRASELGLAIDTLLPGHDLDIALRLDRG